MDDLVVTVRRAGMAIVFLVAGCTLQVPPSTTGGLGFPAVLSVENRGGPALLVVVNGGVAATLECDGAAEVAPAELGVPGLPWNVVIKRRDGDVVLFAGQVRELPKWFVQIGDTTLGLGSTPVSGPAGPPCPTGWQRMRARELTNAERQARPESRVDQARTGRIGIGIQSLLE